MSITPTPSIAQSSSSSIENLAYQQQQSQPINDLDQFTSDELKWVPVLGNKFQFAFTHMFQVYVWLISVVVSIFSSGKFVTSVMQVKRRTTNNLWRLVSVSALWNGFTTHVYSNGLIRCPRIKTTKSAARNAKHSTSSSFQIHQNLFIVLNFWTN